MDQYQFLNYGNRRNTFEATELKKAAKENGQVQREGPIINSLDVVGFHCTSIDHSDTTTAVVAAFSAHLIPFQGQLS